MNKLILGFILLIAIVAYPVIYVSSVETTTITVEEKERITTGSGESISSKFIIYTNGEVMENTDSWLFMKFASADLQNELKVGESYTVKVVGWRVPFLSWYRNIIAIED